MDIKLNTGAPIDRSLIPEPKYKVGDEVFCVESYFENIIPVTITEVHLIFEWNDNGYRSSYKCGISYTTRSKTGNFNDYNEPVLYPNRKDAQEVLDQYRKKRKIDIKNSVDKTIVDLTKQLTELKKKQAAYEQEQGQGASDGTSNSEDVSTILPISENSPTSK